MNNEFHAAVVAERARQANKGYDAAHDDEHGVDHLLMWAQEYAARGEIVESVALIEAAREALMRGNIRIATVRAYIDDPGNWSALDGRRSHLLTLIGGRV